MGAFNIIDEDHKGGAVTSGSSLWQEQPGISEYDVGSLMKRIKADSLIYFGIDCSGLLADQGDTTEEESNRQIQRKITRSFHPEEISDILGDMNVQSPDISDEKVVLNYILSSYLGIDLASKNETVYVSHYADVIGVRYVPEKVSQIMKHVFIIEKRDMEYYIDNNHIKHLKDSPGSLMFYANDARLEGLERELKDYNKLNSQGQNYSLQAEELKFKDKPGFHDAVYKVVLNPQKKIKK